MHLFLICCGLLTTIIWMYLLFAHGGFWRVGRLLPRKNAVTVRARVVAIIPARNEADVIGQSIGSLLLQSNELLHIFLVDDGSTDGTAQRAREAAQQAGRAASLTILDGRPLPAGWSGKLWAMHQGIERARELSPDLLLLTDADIWHAPENVSTLAGIADAGNFDLASFMVKLHCGQLAEKLLVPAFVFFFFKLYPPSWIANPNRSSAGAAGGCMLVRPQALDRAGGIEAIRNEIIDDCALAQRIKRGGGRVWLGPTFTALGLRPYGSFREIGRMISRTAFNQLRHSAALLAGALAGLMLVYLAPVVLLFTGYPPAISLGVAAWLMMTFSYLPMVRFYGLNPAWALALPVTALFYMGATLHSAVKFWSGKGGEWKGRVQDPLPQEDGLPGRM